MPISRIIRLRTVHVVSGNLTLTFENVNPNCFGDMNGIIEVIVNGGTMPYQYNWSNGSTIWNPSGLVAGDYSVTVIDANGCTTGSSFVLDQPEELTISADTFSVTCNGSDGRIDLTITGGTMPYTYTWNTGQTTEDLFGLLPSTYVVTVTDANGCTAEMTFTLAAPDCGLDCDVKILHDGEKTHPVRIIVSSVGDPQNIHYEMFNSLGRKVQEGNLNVGSNAVQVNTLSPGTYYLHIYGDVEVNGKRKLQMLHDAEGAHSWCVMVSE
jgi:hypothetical protein